MMLRLLFAAGLAFALVLTLPIPISLPGIIPGSIQGYIIDSRDIKYQLNRRAIDADLPVKAPTPNSFPKAPESEIQGSQLESVTGFTPETAQKIREGQLQPEYEVVQTPQVLTKDAKSGDGKIGTLTYNKGLEVWMNGVKIRFVRQAKAALVTVSGGLYNPGFDLSSLSKTDATEFRALARVAATKAREVNGMVPIKFWDIRTGQEVWGWHKGDYSAVTMANGPFEGEEMDSEGFMTTGDAKGFKLTADSAILSPANLKGLKLTPKGTFDKSEGLLAGLKINPDATLPTNRLRGLQLARDGNTIAFQGKLAGFKLVDPAVISPYQEPNYHYFTTEGDLKEYVLRSDGYVTKIKGGWGWRPLKEPSYYPVGNNFPAPAKLDDYIERFGPPNDDFTIQWNKGIAKLTAALKTQGTASSKLKRSENIVSKLSTWSSEDPNATSAQYNTTRPQQQIQLYIAFYTACQANVSALVGPIAMGMLASPSPAQLPLLRLAAASLYTDLTRSNILISGPFWQGMYDFTNFTAETKTANLSQAELMAMNKTNYAVANIYLEAWANATRTLNSTTLEEDMDLVGPYLKPKDTSYLPEDWTNQEQWDPNLNAFFPNIGALQ